MGSDHHAPFRYRPLRGRGYDANAAAKELNGRAGYGESHALPTVKGWTVICRWVWE
jgi:hypothetical protein